MPAGCERYRDALSAIADGEVSPVGADELEAHLDACDRCTAFAAATTDLARRMRVTPADDVPDLTASILAAVDSPRLTRARQRVAQLRAILALTGLVQIALMLPPVLSGGLFAGHATREAGILQFALGVGFLVVAWRPSGSAGLLPVAAVVATLATFTSLGDVLAGTASLVQETAHLLEIVGTAVLWVLQRHDGTRARPAVTDLPVGT